MSGNDRPGDNVIGENVVKLLLILRLQQIIQHAPWQLAKGLVGGRKNGEGPLAPKRLHEIGGLEGGHQRLKRARVDRRVHNILLCH